MDADETWAILRRAALYHLEIDIDTVRIVRIKYNALHACTGNYKTEIIEPQLYTDEESGAEIYLGYGPRTQILAYKFSD